jgi:hypothetical protein
MEAWRDAPPILEENLGNGWWIKIRPVRAPDPYQRPPGFDVTVGTYDGEIFDRFDMKSFKHLGTAYLVGVDFVRRRLS